MAVTVEQLEADDDAYAHYAQNHPEISADKLPQTHDDIIKALTEDQQKTPQQKVGLFQQFTTAAGRVTTNTIDSAVSAAESIYDTPGMRKARDVVAGGITGAANIADTVIKAADGTPIPGTNEAVSSPIWDHVKQHIMDFRDAVSVQDPTLADNLVQGVGQLALPFAGFSRALAGLHGVANMAVAGAATDATALDPHAPRMADMLALGRQTEGKFGQVLRTLAPDGSATNAYINYLADHTNETEAEGRWKNVLDGFGVNMIATPLLATVGSVLKQGQAGLRYAIDNGVGSAGDLMPKNQRGSVGDLSSGASADRVAPIMQAPELPPSERDAPTGGMQAPQLPPDQIGAAQNTRVSNSIRSIIGKVNDTGMQTKTGTVGKLLGSVAQNLSDETPEGEFYKDLYQRLSTKVDPDTKIVPENAPGHKFPFKTWGSYNRGTNSISLAKDLATSPKADPMHVLAHEATHSVLMRQVENDPVVQEQIQGVARDALDSAAVKGLSRQDRYGIANLEKNGDLNIDEFMAEAHSNPRFQQALKSTPSRTPGHSLWDEYKGIAGHMLGLPAAVIGGALFDKILTAQEKGEKGA